MFDRGFQRIKSFNKSKSTLRVLILAYIFSTKASTAVYKNEIGEAARLSKERLGKDESVE